MGKYRAFINVTEIYMIKNKKILIILISALIALTIGITLAILAPKPSDVEGESQSETQSTQCEHVYESILVEPTKDKKGYVIHKCMKCKDSYTDNYYDALGSDGLKYTLASNGNLIVTGIGSCTDEEIVIPEVYEGKKVTQIANEAFKSNSIKSVKILGKLDRIGDLAFAGCASLESIYYGGTKAEWESLEKGHRWNADMPKYNVICADGIVN